MSDDSVIVSSVCGEVRIEATLQKDLVCFRTYVLNTVVSKHNLDDQPTSKLSIHEVCAYFATIKNDLKDYLKTRLDHPEKVMQELIADMT